MTNTRANPAFRKDDPQKDKIPEFIVDIGPIIRIDKEFMTHMLKHNKVHQNMVFYSKQSGTNDPKSELESSFDIFKKRAKADAKNLQEVFDDEQYLLQYSLHRDMSFYADRLDK